MAYDLTDGLILIPLNIEPISRPVQAVIPEAEEVIAEPTPVEVEIDVEEEEYAGADYESEYDLEENLIVLVSEMGKIFARSFAAEFKRIIKE
jgi:hypothetical protein